MVYNQRVMEPASSQWFRIEPANLKDLGGLRHLEQVCFPRDAWPLLDLIGVLTFPAVVRLKAVAEGRMIGFVAGDVRQTDRIAWIATIGVLPEFRGRGVGAALLQACEERIPLAVVRLCVRKDNLDAIQMYERFGYQRKGEWSAYYQDGAAALVMEKVRG